MSDNLPSRNVRTGFTWIELVVVVVIIIMLSGLLLPALMGTNLTEESWAQLGKIRPELYELDFVSAEKTAEAMSQKAGQEFAYYEIVLRLAETERFDEAKRLLPKIGSAWHRTHQPPLGSIIRTRFAEALAVADRFDEAREMLKEGAFRNEGAATLAGFLAHADRFDEALAVLDGNPQDDISYKVRQRVAALLARQGEDEKALKIADAVAYDGWQNGTYREIIREQLKRDRYEEATQTFRRMNLVRTMQQAVTLFMIWNLENDHPDEARRLAERFSASGTRGDGNDPFFVDDAKLWRQHAGNERKQPYSPTEWQEITGEIFTAFDRTEESSSAGSPPMKGPTGGIDKNLEWIRAWPPEDESAGWHYEYRGRILVLGETVAMLAKADRRKEAEPLLQRCRKMCRLMEHGDWPGRYSDGWACTEYFQHYHRDLPGWNSTLFPLLLAEIAMDELDAASMTMQRFELADPATRSDGHRRLAAALFKAERNDEAAEQARSALTFARRSGKYGFDLLETLFEIGLADEAKTVFERLERPSSLQFVRYRWLRPVEEVRKEREQWKQWQRRLEILDVAPE